MSNPQKIEAFIGPMKSGKTNFMLDEIEKHEFIEHHVIVFKPLVDTRTGSFIAGRNGEDENGETKMRTHFAFPVKDSHELLQKLGQITSFFDEYNAEAKTLKETFVVAIDEAQFFDEDLPDVLVFIAQELHIKVYVAGLPRDFRGEIFGSMDKLIVRCQEIHTLNALCDHPKKNGRKCGKKATETFRSINGEPANYNDPVIVVGDKKEGYEARCLKHHIVPDKPKKFTDSY